MNLLNFPSFESLEFVVLRSPCFNWFESSSEKVRKSYLDMMTLKLDGYQCKHGAGSHPLDGSDIFCDHLLIVEKSSDRRIPLLGVKTYPYDYSLYYKRPFPFLDFFNALRLDHHYEALRSLLSREREEGSRISYYSSYTMKSSTLQNKLLRRTLKDMFAALTVHYHLENGISELLGIGVPDLKTDKFFYAWGFESMSDNSGCVLPNFPIPFLHNKAGTSMYLRRFSHYALEMADKYACCWKERLEVGESPVGIPGQKTPKVA